MRRKLTWIGLGISVVLSIVALHAMGKKVGVLLLQSRPELLLLSILGLSVYQWLNAGVWSDVLRSMGFSVPRLAAARVWLESEAFKWLPGGIWGYGTRTVRAGDLGVPIVPASASLVLELATTVGSWMLASLGVMGTPAGRQSLGKLTRLLSALPIWGWALALLAVSLLLISPFGRRALGWLRDRTFPDGAWKRISLFHIVRAFLSYFALCLVNGLLLWLVVHAVPGVSVPLLAVIGAGGLRWLAGFFAPVSPGGLGVREAALIGVLALYTPLESAVAVAILFRACQMAAELLGLASSLALGRMGRGNVPAGA